MAVLRIGSPAWIRTTMLSSCGMGRPEFEAAHDRLIASGLFETAGYRFAPAAGGKGCASV